MCVLPPPNWVISVSTGAVLSVRPESRRSTIPACSRSARVKQVRAKNCVGVAIVLRRRPGHDLLERDGELVRVERAAFADFLARRGDLVPGFHGDPPTVSACGRTGRPPVCFSRARLA